MKFPRIRLPYRFLWVWIVLGLLLAGLCSYYFFGRGPKELRQARKDFNDTTKAIGKIYQFPNEVPVLATVTDKEKLAGQPFFDLAENGDKVLVFNTARKVILYRPRTKKIVNFSNLNPSDLAVQAQLPDQQASTAPSPAPPENSNLAKIVLFNGTTDARVTQQFRQRIEALQLDGEIIGTRSAAVTDYKKTLIVALTPVGEVVSSAIAQSLGVTVGSLPVGETAPAGDVLIVIGEDVINP